MQRRRQLRPADQRERLNAYLRTLRANYNRAWRELCAIFRIRKGCPFERALRHRRFEEASELLNLGEQCLAEIHHCYALRLAAFRLGDQILVWTTVAGLPPNPRRYLVLDIKWRKGDEYVYEVHELTKAGTLHKGRYPHTLWPSSREAIETCDELLPREAQWRADYHRRAATELVETVLDQGDLSMFMLEPQHTARPPAQRPYPFWLRST